MPVARRVQDLDASRLEVDALDAASGIGRRLVAGDGEAGDLVPLEPAVVADVDGAVGTDGRAVRSAAGLGHHLDAPAGFDPGEGSTLDLDQQHAAIGHGDGALRKLEATGELAHGSGLLPRAPAVTPPSFREPPRPAPGQRMHCDRDHHGKEDRAGDPLLRAPDLPDDRGHAAAREVPERYQQQGPQGARREVEAAKRTGAMRCVPQNSMLATRVP